MMSLIPTSIPRIYHRQYKGGSDISLNNCEDCLGYLRSATAEWALGLPHSQRDMNAATKVEIEFPTFAPMKGPIQ